MSSQTPISERRKIKNEKKIRRGEKRRKKKKLSKKLSLATKIEGQKDLSLEFVSPPMKLFKRNLSKIKIKSNLFSLNNLFSFFTKKRHLLVQVMNLSRVKRLLNEFDALFSKEVRHRLQPLRGIEH